MSFLPNPWIVLGALVGVMLLCAGSFYEGHHYAYIQAQADQVAAQTKVIATKDVQAGITNKVETATEEKQIEVRTVTQTIIKKVPIYVTAKSDAACTVPVGAVRLLAAAARGLPDLPDPAGRSDDSASGIELSAVVASGAEDLGTCKGDQARLAGLQAWVDAQSKVK